MVERRSWRLILIVLVCLYAICGAVSLCDAQTSEPEADVVEDAIESSKASVTEQKLTVGEVLDKGGPLMYALIVASFLAAALIIYFFFVLRREQVVPRSLCRELSVKASSGSLEELQGVCQRHPSPLSSVTLVALDSLRGGADVPPDALQNAVIGEGTRQAEVIQGQTRYLMDIAAIAPMIGLLGTVIGMVKAFRGVALDEAMARPQVLADGIQQALYTTAAGLVVAIPAAIFYAFFRERASSLVSQLEASSLEVLRSLQRKRPR